MDEENLKATDHRMKFWLALIGTGTVFLLVAAALRENVFTQWQFVRHEYAGILREKAVDEQSRSLAEHFKIAVDQNVVPALGRIDRCITCHPGVDDPRMQDQPQPFRTHPGDYLKNHIPDKFGCTICHRGQGRAVVFDDAKGIGHHWDYPLLPPNLTQSSCGVCHTPEEVRNKGGEKFAIGSELFVEKGCQACHKLNGRGGNMGPELDSVGLKVRAQLPMAGVEGEYTLPQWLSEHFDDPQRLVAGSQMKSPKLSADENEALTIYMLSLQGRDLPESFISPEKHLAYYRESYPEPESGRALYQQFCSSCHDTGTFSRFDKFYNKFIPAIRSVSYVQLATPEYVRANISAGRPGTLMPGWQRDSGGLSEEEIRRIQEFLLAVQVPADMKLPEQLVQATNDPSMQFRGDKDNGAVLFARNCIGCHGRGGMGKLAPSLTSRAFSKNATDGFIFATIAAGRRNTAMPGFLAPGAGGLDGQEVMDLIAYIRSLVKAN